MICVALEVCRKGYGDAMLLTFGLEGCIDGNMIAMDIESKIPCCVEIWVVVVKMAILIHLPNI